MNCSAGFTEACLFGSLQNALSEELANMKKLQDDLLANKVPVSLDSTISGKQQM